MVNGKKPDKSVLPVRFILILDFVFYVISGTGQ
jgi:hypothetical protein